MNKFNPKKTKMLLYANLGLDLFFNTPKSTSKINWKKVKSILVVDFTGIGDLVMLTPFLRILKKNAADSFIDLACNGYGEVLLSDQNLVREFYCLDGKKYANHVCKLIIKDKTIKQYIDTISRTSYDLIIEPRGDLRYIYFMHLLNGKRKISYNYTGGESLLTDVVKPDEKVAHLLEDKIVLLKKLGCRFTRDDEVPFLSISNERMIFANAFRNKHELSGRVIGIHPGASQELRRWDKYPELVERIHSIFPFTKFIVFSSAGEEQYANDVIKKAQAIGCDAVRVEESLNNYISLILSCDMMICNDSGAAHISSAFGIPTIVLFGPNVPEFSKPNGRGDIKCISNMFKCKPCGLEKCLFSNKCIRSISVDQVLGNVIKML